MARQQSNAVIQVANLLCPGNTVLSGSMAGLEAAEAIAAEKGYRTVRLAVAGAFHTRLMEPADQAVAQALAGVTVRPPRVPVWSNVDAQPHTDPAEIKDLLVRQVLSPVRMEECLRGVLAAGVEQAYEIGPGKVIAGLFKRIDRKAPCTSVPA
jgi:[acyl-carrier-protein] S-malonyltransferase